MGFFQSLTDGIGLTNYGDQAHQMGLAQAQFAGLNLPELTPIELERMVSAGEITPEFAEILKLESNAYKDIYVDPRFKAQQLESLDAMKELSETGMTAQDRADLARIAQEEAIAERGQREALIQQAQMKGISGSGLDLAQQIANQQAGATRRSSRDTEIAGIAGDRRIAALQQAGQMAGSLRSQDYGEQAAIAQAQQLIDQFNVQNQQAQLSQRAAYQNAAQEANLANAQNIMNQNVALANQEEMYRSQIPQMQYQNALGLAGAKAGGYYNMANMYGQQSGQALQGVGAAAGAIGMAMASDEDVKENIHLGENEIDNLLEELTGYSFRYKDEDIAKGIGTPGNKVGVMAQDMEEVLPQSVTTMQDNEGDMLKALDLKEILPAVLAGTGRLHERLKKLEENNG